MESEFIPIFTDFCEMESFPVTTLTSQISISSERHTDNNNNYSKICEVCQTTIVGKKGQLLHRWFHEEKTVYSCQLCQAKYDDFQLLRSHENDHYQAALEELAKKQKEPKFDQFEQNFIPGGDANMEPVIDDDDSASWYTCKIEEKGITPFPPPPPEPFHLFRRESMATTLATTQNPPIGDSSNKVSVIKPPPPPYYGTHHQLIQPSRSMYNKQLQSQQFSCHNEHFVQDNSYCMDCSPRNVDCVKSPPQQSWPAQNQQNIWSDPKPYPVYNPLIPASQAFVGGGGGLIFQNPTNFGPTMGSYWNHNNSNNNNNYYY